MTQLCTSGGQLSLRKHHGPQLHSEFAAHVSVAGYLGTHLYQPYVFKTLVLTDPQPAEMGKDGDMPS